VAHGVLRAELIGGCFKPETLACEKSLDAESLDAVRASEMKKNVSAVLILVWKGVPRHA
jgi:hypothetical protein